MNSKHLVDPELAPVLAMLPQTQLSKEIQYPPGWFEASFTNLQPISQNLFTNWKRVLQ